MAFTSRRHSLVEEDFQIVSKKACIATFEFEQFHKEPELPRCRSTQMSISRGYVDSRSVCQVPPMVTNEIGSIIMVLVDMIFPLNTLAVLVSIERLFQGVHSMRSLEH